MKTKTKTLLPKRVEEEDPEEEESDRNSDDDSNDQDPPEDPEEPEEPEELRKKKATDLERLSRLTLRILTLRILLLRLPSPSRSLSLSLSLRSLQSSDKRSPSMAKLFGFDSPAFASLNSRVTRLGTSTTAMTYDSDKQAAFLKSAQKFVLSKGNKLKVFSMDMDDEKKLDHVRSLGLQLKLLKDHLIDHDIFDVFRIVFPKDVTKGPQISKDTYDLFSTYPKLHGNHVAASCAWYNSWTADDYIAENMKLSFEFFRNNTDEHLFNKTLESYERFPVLCRGGPLMAYLLLSKILTTTESAIEILMAKIKSLKIRDSKGEDVDAVVSLVRSTVDVLLSASDVGRSYIPDDFPKTILQVFQSSSNKEFNETFAEEQRTVQRESDRNGTKPLWPTVEGTLLQAERVYQRLVTEGEWCVSASKKRAALNVRESTPSDKHHLVISLSVLVGTVENKDVLSRSARSPKIKTRSKLTARSFSRPNKVNSDPLIVRTRVRPIRKMQKVDR